MFLDIALIIINRITRYRKFSIAGPFGRAAQDTMSRFSAPEAGVFRFVWQLI